MMREGKDEEEDNSNHKRCKKNEKREGEYWEKWGRQENYRTLYNPLPTRTPCSIFSPSKSEKPISETVASMARITVHNDR
jgi:hypothetical protein